MALILCIDTSASVCSVSISNNGIITESKEDLRKNSHSEVINLLIKEVVDNAKISFSDINAVAISKGPGSYTGLRIGVNTAKGLCYATSIPLIGLNTLEVLTQAAIKKIDKIESNYIFCPTIDARRMEVYYLLLDSNLNEIKKTDFLIVEENSFDYIDKDKQIIIFGDGAEKLKPILASNKNISFIDNLLPNAIFMGGLAEQYFNDKKFEELVNFEPFYLKEFIAGKPKNLLS